ncbi:MAG TPA: sigma-70 family RNA polymerase sigma factor [Candidatus Didemnitutus sp.]|jgi:RNA polymerase sigma factor (sigma-70 family)
MSLDSDHELLARFHRDASDGAFAEIVRRHLNLVYAAARRRLGGDASLAEEVSQNAFVALATRARQGRSIGHVAAWLHGTTRHLAAHAVRAERRRKEREMKAHELDVTDAVPGPPGIPPEMIDRILDDLGASDREAVVRRFFEDRSLAEIGAALGISEDAARMRLARALEKLRRSLARRGIRSSTAALGLALSHETLAAPAGLAATVHAAAVAIPAGAVSSATVSAWVIAKWIVGVSAFGLAAGLALLAIRTPPPPAVPAPALSDGSPVAIRAEKPPKPVTIAATSRIISAPPTLPAPPPPAPAPSPPNKDAARLARVKPWLAAGQPITGYVALQNGDSPADVPVSFVIGQDTVVDTGDGNTVTFHPELADDGSVLYALKIHSEDSNGREVVTSMPSVLQVPWSSFSIYVESADGGHLIAFDPDSDQFVP